MEKKQKLPINFNLQRDNQKHHQIIFQLTEGQTLLAKNKKIKIYTASIVWMKTRLSLVGRYSDTPCLTSLFLKRSHPSLSIPQKKARQTSSSKKKARLSPTKFRKSLVQERFKSNLEFRYQIIVSSIKLRKGFAKFMIPIALFKKFLS